MVTYVHQVSSQIHITYSPCIVNTYKNCTVVEPADCVLVVVVVIVGVGAANCLTMAYMLCWFCRRQGRVLLFLAKKKTQLTKRQGEVRQTKEDIVKRNEQFVEQPACSLGQSAAAII